MFYRSLGEGVVEKFWKELERTVGVLEKSDVETWKESCIKVLEKSVGEKCCRRVVQRSVAEESCGEVLGKSFVEKCWGRVLWRRGKGKSVVERWFVVLQGQ